MYKAGGKVLMFGRMPTNKFKRNDEICKSPSDKHQRNRNKHHRNNWFS